jgi:hypothetical protein
MCGSCNVVEFGGLCPKAQCPKELLNGPCGGAIDGMCEVNKGNECVWNLIYERLKKIKRLDLLYVVHAPQEHCLK